MSKGDYAEMFMKVPFRKDDGFYYSNDDAYMLAAAVTKVAGESLVDYLMPRLFEPLGIEKPFLKQMPGVFVSAVTASISRPWMLPKYANVILAGVNTTASR